MKARQLRQDSRFVLGNVIAAMCIASASACWSSPDDRSAASALSTSEDSDYTAKLKKYLRDSTVLDSLMKLVSTDSLYKLYRRALEPAGADQALVQSVFCEETRLALARGSIPSERAIAHMLDTVYRDKGIRDAFRYFAARAPAGGRVESGPCEPLPPRSPIKVSGTSTDIEPYRPSRPPWWHW